MVSLEQVKLLETKVARAIEFVKQVSGENAALQEKLESYQKRIDELEVLVQRFKEEQGRIEDGILSALDKLNQFEDAIEKSLNSREAPAQTVQAAEPPADIPAEEAAGDEDPEPDGGESGGGEALETDGDEAAGDDDPETDGGGGAGDPPAKDGELDIF
jgi:chromosome segregation ATPase